MATEADKASKLTPVNFQHSPSLVPLLNQLGLSLIVSTYQAGKVISVGVHEDKADIRFHHFEQAMGMARTPTGLMIGAKRQIWSLQGSPTLAPQVKPAGKHDVAFLTRSAHYTGPVMGHEMGWGKNELWFVNTLFSCLCVLQPEYNFVPRWKPAFITELAAEDRCHLNGLAMEGDEPRYVTALGTTDKAGGWRENKATGGVLMDVRSKEVILRGLCMPHSPRIHQGQLYYLDSGKGQLCRFDAKSGIGQPIAAMQGYARGMEMWGQYAFVGLSKIRETSVFGGVPIAEKRESLKCGISIIDLKAGAVVGFLHFHSGVDEIFEVKVIPGYRNPIISGPLPDADQAETIWLAPPLPQ